MKRKAIIALMLGAAVMTALPGCTHKNKDDSEKTQTKTDKDSKKKADDIEEREIKATEAETYRVTLGDYTVTFEAEKGFTQTGGEQMPEEAAKLGARAVKYNNENGDEIFISYSPEEMTPNVGNATNAKEYMMLEDDGTTSKWAEDVTAGNWKGFHYKATTSGNNQVGYDLYYDAQEIKISISSSNGETYPMLDKINITGEKKKTDQPAAQEQQNNEQQNNSQNVDQGEGDPEEESESAPEGAGDPDDYADEDGE